MKFTQRSSCDYLNALILNASHFVLSRRLLVTNFEYNWPILVGHFKYFVILFDFGGLYNRTVKN